jgi:hypothetical protein
MWKPPEVTYDCRDEHQGNRRKSIRGPDFRRDQAQPTRVPTRLVTHFHFGFPSQTWPNRMFPAANTGALNSGKLRDTALRAIKEQFVARVTLIPKNKT